MMRDSKSWAMRGGVAVVILVAALLLWRVLLVLLAESYIAGLC